MMKLEKAIKQKSFKTEYQKLAVNIIYTHNWLMSFNKKIFEEFNITTNQYNILRILRGQHPNPASINLLKDRMLDKMSDTSRLVERLRKKGLVVRYICPEDRRKSDVKITEEGLRILRELDNIEDKFADVMSNITKKEAKQLNDILDKMRG